MASPFVDALPLKLAGDKEGEDTENDDNDIPYTLVGSN